MNRFSTKQYHVSNSSICQHLNPYRIKRTYNAMLEQEHITAPTVYMNNKRFKQSESKPAESLIKNNRPKISEKLKREIELYNYERRGYNMKIVPCNCDN